MGPPTFTEAKSAKLKVKVVRYILIDNILYKKSFSLPYLKCLGQDEVEYALREIHEGIYGQHLGDNPWPIKHSDRDSMG